MFEGWRGLSHPLPNLKSKLSMITFQFHKMCEAITRCVNRSFYINHQRLHLHSTLPHPTLWTRNTVHHKHLHLPLLQVMEYNSPPLPTLQVTEYNMLWCLLSGFFYPCVSVSLFGDVRVKNEFIHTILSSNTLLHWTNTTQPIPRLTPFFRPLNFCLEPVKSELSMSLCANTSHSYSGRTWHYSRKTRKSYKITGSESRRWAKFRFRRKRIFFADLWHNLLQECTLPPHSMKYQGILHTCIKRPE